MRIVRVKNSDLSNIVKLHHQAFPGFFLTTLGDGFLNVLYDGFLTVPNGILIGLEDGGRFIGFVAGSIDPNSFFRLLRKKKWFAFIKYAAPALVLRPRTVARKLFYAFRYHGNDSPEIATSGALLSSICVDNSYRGTGAAKILIAEFEFCAKSLGAAAVFLSTDAINNERANKFYSSTGFKSVSEYIKDGSRKMVFYKKDL